MARIFFLKIFQNWLIFKFSYFSGHQLLIDIYYCFLLDFTKIIIPAIELISIWCTLYRMSIYISI